jgi:hypothetical protein
VKPVMSSASCHFPRKSSNTREVCTLLSLGHHGAPALVCMERHHTTQQRTRRGYVLPTGIQITRISPGTPPVPRIITIIADANES